MPVCNGLDPTYVIKSFRLSLSINPDTKPILNEIIGFWKKDINIKEITINNLYI